MALTDREKAMLQRLAEGDTLPVAAREAGYKTLSAAKHALGQTKRRLGAKNITHAVVLAARKGLFSEPSVKDHNGKPLDPEVKAQVTAQYPSVDYGEDEWLDAFDQRPDMYDRMLRDIVRKG